jgi:hypothetical protein
MDSGFTLRVPRNDTEGVARNDGGESYAGNRVALSSNGSLKPFARYDTVR